MCQLRIPGGFNLTRRLAGIVHLSCFPSAKRITVVSGIAVHAGIPAHQDQLQDKALEWAAPSMTANIEAPTIGALANRRPRLQHLRHVSQCSRRLVRLSTPQGACRNSQPDLQRVTPNADLRGGGKRPEYIKRECRSKTCKNGRKFTFR
jgi:hypothetical protein